MKVGNTGRTEEKDAKKPEPEPEDTRFSVNGTDLTNARLFVKHHGRDIRYVPQFKGWLIWNGVHWRSDDTHEIERRAKQTVDQMTIDALSLKDEKERINAVKAAITCYERKKIMDMITLARSEKEVVITASKLDSNPNLLGVKNGVIDLKTGKFIEPKRELYITKSCAVAYDPDAQCPNWLAFLKKVTTENIQAYLARVVGYLLTGSVAEEKAFLLWGNGSNGKTTFRETIFHMLGDYTVAGTAAMLTAEVKPGAASPELAQLRGVRVLAINEMTDGSRINEERFKYLNGNDTMKARGLYESPFDFQPSHKTIITTNYKPRIKDTDEGIWRKLELIPFVITIEGKDKNVNFREEKLIPELPGILNFALRGLADYRKRGLAPPEEVTRATKNYRSEEDIIQQWFDDCCVRDDKAETPASELLASLKEWTFGEDTPSSTRLGRWLENKNFEQKRSKKSRKWKGIKLKDDEGEKAQFRHHGYKDGEDYAFDPGETEV